MKDSTLPYLSRNPYTFNICSGAQTCCARAVYAVLSLNQPGYSVLYISSTAQLATHLTNGDRSSVFYSEGCTHIGVLIEPVVSRRLAKMTGWGGLPG